MKLSQAEFDSWASTALQAFAEAPVAHDLAVLFATSDSRTFLGQTVDEHLVVRAFSHDEFMAHGEDSLNRLMLDGPPRKLGAIATRTHWSPSQDEPTVDAWLATVVASGHAAIFGIRRWTEDQLWHRLDPRYAPWLILSCASGIRAVLDDAKPMVFKAAVDKRLFNTIDEEPPPKDEHGRI